jgi:hypothetical protein
MIPEQQISMAQRAVAIPMLGWRLRVEASHTGRFDTMSGLRHTLRPHGQSPLPLSALGL